VVNTFVTYLYDLISKGLATFTTNQFNVKIVRQMKYMTP